MRGWLYLGRENARVRSYANVLISELVFRCEPLVQTD